MKMKELEENFEKLNDNEFYKLIKKLIASQYRRENVKLCRELTELAKKEMTEDKRDSLYDILDAMTGYCAFECRLGTGDYHL